MKEPDLTQFYERLHYHELEMREHLTARMQLLFGLLIVLVTADAYLITKFAFASVKPAFSVIAFGILFLIAVVLHVVSAVRFIGALWGHQYECLPFASEINGHRAALQKTYAGREDCEALIELNMHSAIRDYFVSCASSNAKVNAHRSDYLHDSISYCVWSLAPMGVAFLFFALGNLHGPLN